MKGRRSYDVYRLARRLEKMGEDVSYAAVGISITDKYATYADRRQVRANGGISNSYSQEPRVTLPTLDEN